MDTNGDTPRDEATFTVKAGLAEMLKGGVIMDVVTPEQAKIAEDAGAAAVMALERVPADIRRDGGVARMSDPAMIKGIQEAVTIPVMAKARIGHFAEAQVLEALEVDYIDESEVLTPADEANHIDKWTFKIPFVCGATNLGEALRRIGEGAAMIRSKGEAGTGDIVEAVRHLRMIRRDGGVARMSDPLMIKGIQEAVTIPVMAKARIGHFAEAQVLQAIGVDYIDESEVLT
ncbi:MAG: pyridoxal 5'-phosphate synthase lyase subunit PdxS, partial [Solirubrobacteraceae bacterium]